MICRPIRMTLMQPGVAGAESSYKNSGAKTWRRIGGSLTVMAPSLYRPCCSDDRRAALCRCGVAIKFV